MKRENKFMTHIVASFLLLCLGSIFLFKFFLIRPFENRLHSNFIKNSETAFHLLDNFIQKGIKFQLKQICYSFKSTIRFHLKNSRSKNIKSIYPFIDHIITGNHVGKKGYLYLTDSKGIILAHVDKNLVGKKSIFHEDYLLPSISKDSFKKYRFKASAKFLYRTYLKEYKIFITVSIAKEDFNTFIPLNDLKKILFPLNKHQLAYFYLIDSKGNIILHKDTSKEKLVIFDYIKAHLNSFTYYGKSISFAKKKYTGKNLGKFKNIFNLLKVDKKGFFSYSLKNEKNPSRFAYFYYLTDLNEFIVSAFDPVSYFRPFQHSFYILVSIVFILCFILILWIYYILKLRMNILKSLNHTIASFFDKESPHLRIEVNNLSEFEKFRAYMLSLTKIFKAKSSYFLKKEDEKIQEIEKKESLLELQQQKQERDWAFAKKIQQKLLPLILPFVKGIKIAHLFHQEHDISSSFYDFLRFREPTKIGFFLSKISGDGVPLVLMNSVLKSLLLNCGAHKLSPKELFFYLNDKIKKEFTTQEHFLSSLYGLYDHEKGTFKFSQASFPNPILIRNKQIIVIEDFQSSKKSLNNFLLGVLENEQIDFKETEIKLQKKDRLFLFSDTLLNVQNQNHQLFQSVLSTFLLKTNKLPLQKALEQLFQNLLIFSQSNHLSSEICLIALEIL